MEILEILESRASVENKGESKSDHFFQNGESNSTIFLETWDFQRFYQDSRDSSSETTAFVLTPFFPEGQRHTN